jgi:homoaconitate hydratase
MARVVMENHDPAFAGLVEEGDVLVGGSNFGTGSSREQAVTALQAKGIAMVIAASFSQTYLRNAFNNGFVCITCPELVADLHHEHAAEAARGQKTIMSRDPIVIDFASGAIAHRGYSYRFPPLGTVPQALVIVGGVENQVRQRLGLE